jgi:pheromone a factor receptor
MGLQAAFISLHIICFFLNIPPLIWHIMCKNIPATTLLVYLEIMMINGFVGAIVWGGSNYVTAWDGKGWCDLMIRFQLAISVGISSSISCVSLNLLMIFLTNKATTFWFNNKWVKPSVEIFCSIIFPFLISGISYFAQISRYMISQYSGCYAVLTKESISIVTFYLWIFFWSFVGTVFSFITLFLYFKKKRAAKEILVCTNSGLSVKRFIRLLAYCVLVICASIVFSAIIGSRLSINKDSFYNKKIVHGPNWGFIYKTQHLATTDTNKWVLISISFISFFLFGVGQDAKKMYVTLLSKIPFGDSILKLCEKINIKFNNLIGNYLINNETKYLLKFWDSEDDNGDEYNDNDDESTDVFKDNIDIEKGSKKDKKDKVGHKFDFDLDNDYDKLKENSKRNGIFYSPSDGCPTSYSDAFSTDKNFAYLFEEQDHELNSPTTLGTSNNMHNYYEDTNLRAELEEAEREIQAQAQAQAQAENFDELKYLYY